MSKNSKETREILLVCCLSSFCVFLEKEDACIILVALCQCGMNDYCGNSRAESLMENLFLFDSDTARKLHAHVSFVFKISLYIRK